MYRIDINDLTVIRTDKNGCDFDMNAGGEPCKTIADLMRLVETLWEQGAYDVATAQGLASDVVAAVA